MEKERVVAWSKNHDEESRAHVPRRSVARRALSTGDHDKCLSLLPILPLPSRLAGLSSGIKHSVSISNYTLRLVASLRKVLKKKITTFTSRSLGTDLPTSGTTRLKIYFSMAQ